MNPIKEFEQEVADRIRSYATETALRDAAAAFMLASTLPKYSYNFAWQGRPIIQYPQDIVAVQEIVWRTRPDLIIETGIAHGGSLIFSASLLAMLDYCDAVTGGTTLDPRKTRRRVLGVDIDIRPHNHAAIEAHPMSHRIDMIQGSAIAPDVVAQVKGRASQYERVLVLLDSNHTHEHVLAELEAYAPLVTPGGYCCVFDTMVEDLPDELFAEKAWGKGDNPKTAVWEYLRRLKEDGRMAADGQPLKLEIDRAIDQKLLVTVAPDGYLRRVAG